MRREAQTLRRHRCGETKDTAAGSSLQHEEKGGLKKTREWERVLREGREKKLNPESGEVGTQRTEALQPPKGGHCSLVPCHSQMAALLTQNFSLFVFAGKLERGRGQLFTGTSLDQGSLCQGM